VVLECVSNQDTVRLQWLVPLQVNHVCVPLNPKVLWSSWLWEKNMKAISILLFVTNITCLMDNGTPLKAEHGESYLPPWFETPQCYFVVPHTLY